MTRDYDMLTDAEWREEVITRVESNVIATATGAYPFTARLGVTPEVGDTARFYGDGEVVRGIVVIGRGVICYRTAAEVATSGAIEAEWEVARRQQRLDRERVWRDGRWAVLPPEFRERRDRFIANRPAWRRDHETYELFVAEEAMVIARYFRTAEAFARHNQLPPGERSSIERRVLNRDHTGNTYVMATGLAAAYLESPAKVIGLHGALCTVVGCAEYGCLPSHTAECRREPDAETVEITALGAEARRYRCTGCGIEWEEGYA